MKPVIAISMGDYNGIGPEVIIKSYPHIDPDSSVPVVIGHEKVFQLYDRILGTGLNFKSINNPDDLDCSQGTLHILTCSGDEDIDLHPGRGTVLSGKAAMEAVATGVDLCLRRKSDALVTAPISKKAIQDAGYLFPGHTEFLAEKTGTSDFQMILVNGSLRVALATIHIPVSRIPGELTRSVVEKQLVLLSRSLHTDFGLKEPKIAVLGLNPHAGDGGVIGSEEQSVIQPAIESAAARGISVHGPFAADGFFGSRSHQEYDAVLAMYHDQGLIPFKTLSFGSGVNFTAGLPIVRTSPDHGTGFDIAGKNKASEHSFRAAYELAVHMATNRRKAHEKKR